MASEADDQLSTLLDALFGGLVATQPWDAFLRVLSDWLAASHATLMLTAPGLVTPGSMVSPGADPDKFDAYIAGFFASDPFKGLPDGRVVSFTEFHRENDSPELREYRAFLEAIDGIQVLAIDLRFPSGLEARWRVTRSRVQKDFTRRDRAAFQALVPHLRNAVQLFERLQLAGAEHGVYRSAVDQLGVAGIILDGDGRVVGTNAVADRLLAEAVAVARRVDGTLRFADDAQQRTLSDIISGRAITPWRFKIAGHEGEDLSGVARAVTIPEMMRGGAALAIFLTPTHTRGTLDPSAVRDLFGLTPSEARLATALADGQSLVDVAQRLGFSYNTARTHLRAIFAKTGARRQAQLVNLLRGGLP